MVYTDPGEYRQLRFQPAPGAAELLLVRHGESAAFRPGESFQLLDGQADPELHPNGRKQAAKLAERLAGESISAIYVSTLRRTADTARPLACRLGLEPTVDPDLREVFLGEWEGGTFRHKVASGHPTAILMAEQERWDVIPGAEPAAAFAVRVRSVLMRIAARHRGGMVAVFTHGGFIGQALAEASASRPFAFTGADNASISHIVIDGSRWVVRRYNDTAHLHFDMTAASEPLV